MCHFPSKWCSSGAQMWPPMVPEAGRVQTTASEALPSPAMVGEERTMMRLYSGTEPVK